MTWTSWLQQRDVGGFGCCSTWFPTTRATDIRGSSSPSSRRRPTIGTSTCGPIPLPTGRPRTTGWVALEVLLGPSTRPRASTSCTTFCPEQPDLNWWCQDVRSEFDDILRFWWDRGIEGFRIDVCHMVVKDAELRDNPPATEDDPFIMQMFGQRPLYTSNRPEVHDVLRHWRELADGYDPPRVLLGETSVESLDTLASFYGKGEDELSLAFNFPFIESPFESGALREIVERTEALLPPRAWPVWTGSNHDVSRLSTRWAGGDSDKVRLALLMLLTLRGTPVLYQGDEIGLTDVELTRDQIRDPVGLRFWPAYRGRDAARTPMPWIGGAGGGFSDADTTPWLPMGDPSTCNVQDQRDQPGSVLRFVRDVVALRRRSADLLSGEYRSYPSPDGTWVWRRGSNTVVALNMSESPTRVELSGGSSRICHKHRPRTRRDDGRGRRRARAVGGRCPRDQADEVTDDDHLR